ncbi:MAG: DUF2269 domain-containing protein [Candidatus Dormibacteria bacterium]
MGPGLRKLALTVHISTSVGWLGAVLAFLAVATSGLARRDPQLLKAAYIAMDWIGWYGLVPLSFASLLSGLLQALGTHWGLFRHYWVLFKLGINLLANGVLLLFMLGLSGIAARAAAETTLSSATIAELRGNFAPVLHASVAVALLVAATVLSVYKPQGRTPYGWSKDRERPARVPLG